ncbi:MAG: membrane protein insertase YidC [Elusimicrobiota bacterium]
MDKNLWLAVALSIAVYASWFGFFEKKFAPPPQQPVHVAATAAQSQPHGTAKSSPDGALPASQKSTTSQTDPKTLLAEADSVLMGEVQAKIHSRGAALASYLYPEPLGHVELVAEPGQGLFMTFPELNFTRDLSVKNGLVYSALRADGLKVSKEYLPGQGTVLPRVRIVVLNTTRQPLDIGPWTLSVGPGLATIATEQKENADVQRALALTPEANGLKGHVETLKPGQYPGAYRWLGIDNRYFLAVMMPSAEHFAAAQVLSPATLILTAKTRTVAPRGTFTWEIPYYLGAKSHNWLSSYGLGLERAIDFGFFSQIGRAMLGALQKLHQATNNWGWAIVLLTVILQVILFPLTWKSLRAAAAMKKLQPEIAKLQQKYANDAQKLNSEMMQLYKTKGANPLGGCLPMILQMPIFIALFNALRGSWELHGATWIFWIRDLSAKDPYYVLPVVMGALMFLQSKMNPPAGDPAQQKVMMLMPVVFTFMFMNFPSGLVLYWLTNSLVSTVAQIALKKQLEA